MKKLMAAILAAALMLAVLPVFAKESSIGSTKAFGWNFTQNAQHKSVTAVSWNDYRAVFMTFESPEIASDDAVLKAEGVLSAKLTFDNGRVAGQAPLLTIFEADAQAIANTDLTKGASASSALKNAVTQNVLGQFNTLSSDKSEKMDLTEILKKGGKHIGFYISCRNEDNCYVNNGIVNFASPVLTLDITLLSDLDTAEKRMEFDFSRLSAANVSETKTDLSLEERGEVSGAKITWTSSDENVISPSGKVTRQEKDTSVTLTASMTLDEITLSKDYTITVIGSDLPVRAVKDGEYIVSKDKYNSYETKHFQILWGNEGKSNKVTDDFLKGSSKILEDCWEIFIEEMGMTPPTTTITGTDETEYKVNVVVMGTGIDGYLSGWAYGGVDREGYPYLMCDPDAMTPQPESWVIPHEFGHVTHFAQGRNAWSANPYLSPWYEAIGNWFREQYLKDTQRYTAGLDYRTDLSPLYLRAANLTACNGRAYYEAWPLLEYMTVNPDELDGYGSDFVSKMLNYRSETDTIYHIIEKLNPSVSYEDTLGYYASRMATMDFKERRDNLRAKLGKLLSERSLYWQQFYTMPISGNTENMYYVYGTRAPQGGGYNIIPLEAQGDVTVKLSGLTHADGAAWKARLVVMHKDGETEYSPLFGENESATVNAAATDSVYLSVAATPSLNTLVKCGIANWDNKFSEANIPYDSKTRYPYSIELTNAAIAKRPSFGIGHRHSNGGGYVASTASVAQSVYVGENAAVLGYAKVSGNAVIDGSAIVDGNAEVTDNAYIGGEAVVNGRAKVSGNAKVLENALVTGEYSVKDNAVIKGQAIVQGNGTAMGSAEAYGDFFEDMGHTIKGGSFAGYESAEASTYGHFSDKYAKRDSDGAFYRESVTPSDEILLFENGESITAIGKGVLVVAEYNENALKKVEIHTFNDAITVKAPTSSYKAMLLSDLETLKPLCGSISK